MKKPSIKKKKLETGLMIHQVKKAGVIQIVVASPEVIPFRFRGYPEQDQEEEQQITHRINAMASDQGANINYFKQLQYEN